MDHPRTAPEPLTPPPYPGTVLAAGIIWIVLGGLILLNLPVLLLSWLRRAAEAGPDRGGIIIEAVFGGLFVAAVGGFFLYEGVQTVRRRLPDPLGIAVGSILLALIYLGFVFTEAEARRLDFAFAYGGVVAAVAFLSAGTLALLGRAKHQSWRRTLTAISQRRRGPEPSGFENENRGA
jgi:hypothetical protein